MSRTVLKIAIDTASSALSCKERVEALSFAIMIKYNFRSSMIKRENLSGRAFKTLMRDKFHVGFERGKRCIKNGLKYNYLFHDTCGNIIAAKLYTEDKYVAKIDVADLEKTYRSTGECHINISVVRDAILKAVTLNHTRKQSDAVDTCNICGNPKNLNAYRKAKKRMDKYATTKGYGMLSAKRLSSVLNCKTYKARKILKSLTISGFLVCHPNYIEVKADAITHVDVIEWIESGMRGYLTSIDGKVFVRVANSYLYNYKKETIRWER